MSRPSLGIHGRFRTLSFGEPVRFGIAKRTCTLPQRGPHLPFIAETRKTSAGYVAPICGAPFRLARQLNKSRHPIFHRCKNNTGAAIKEEKSCHNYLKMRVNPHFHVFVSRRPLKLWSIRENRPGPWQLYEPDPGLELKYWSNFAGLPSHSLASGGGSPLTVIFGQTFANSVFTSSHRSRPDSVSGRMASAGHSGSHTPQSMHSSGWMTSMFSPS